MIKGVCARGKEGRCDAETVLDNLEVVSGFGTSPFAESKELGAWRWPIRSGDQIGRGRRGEVRLVLG
jgi:hypothetical protein